MDLRGQNIVITGATGGIGRALAISLSKSGANLILISKTESELKNLSELLGGKNNIYFVCDLRSQKEIHNLITKIASKFDTIDVLIQTAGIGIYKPLGEVLDKDWNDSLNINVSSIFLINQGLEKQLRNSKSALVMNIGSGAGVIPMAKRSVYCTTKFAVRGMTLSLAEEFKETNVHYCLITLGSTLTAFGPLGLERKKELMAKGRAYFTPEWVANKLVEIIEDDNREVEYTLYPGDYGLGWWKPA